MRELSELEGVCLGFVRAESACTAYVVRQRLQASPSSHWRASSGSVYPLIKRLEAEGFVQAKADAHDGRGRRMIGITALGRRALRDWILKGGETEIIESLHDPIRTRIFFLSALTQKQRLKYLDGLIASLEKSLELQKLHCEALNNDLFGYLGSRGVVLTNRSRLEWLKEVKTHLG